MKGYTVDLHIPTKLCLQSVFALHSLLKNACILIVFFGVTNSTHAQDTLLLNEGRLLENPNQDIGIISIQNNQVVNKQILPSDGAQTQISNQLVKNVNSIITYDDKLKSIDQDAKTVFERNIGYRDSYEDVLLIPEVHSSNNATYQPSVISSKPFVYNEQISGFESAVNFILLGEANDKNAKLEDPVYLELHSDELLSIEPDSILIDHLNLPSTEIDLVGENIKDSVVVRIVTTNNTDGYKANLTVEPSLQLFTNRNSLQGYGIQEIPIHVRWRGSSQNDSTKITFTSEKGDINPTSLPLKYDSSATVYLRSESLGSTVITASTASENSNSITLQFIFPWVFLGFAVAGGFIGSIARYFLNTQTQKSLFKLAIGGIFIGLISAIAYFALGINLLQFELSSTFNEFAVMGISGLTAYFSGNLSGFDK